MATWSEFRAAAPDLAAEVRRRFDAHTHLTVATLRRDGSPRICGTEITIAGGELYLAGMTGALRFADLRRDPRLALHSGSDDPPAWSGDAKVAGRAVEVDDPAAFEAVSGASPDSPSGPFELFRLDLTEAVVLGLTPDRSALVVESWHEGRGVTRVERR